MKTVLLSTVHFYRRWISPILPGACRFAPTCSSYALEAIEKHGSVKGSALTLSRLARCHPFNPGGWDPVPPQVEPEYSVLSTQCSDRPGSKTKTTATNSIVPQAPCAPRPAPREG